ncbi:MAG: AraC family transcriptional regulator [Kangiella sp.]|jgi:AraC-like DNA-binding protein|nr:AraC family transcriptional regulator [Kangiella sp.]
MDSYSLVPVNILQIVFFALTSFGALLVANQRRYQGLFWLLISTSALMVFNLLEETGVSEYLISPVFSLICGPLFYWFVRQLVYANTQQPKHYLLHFIPAIVAIPFTLFPQLVLLLGTLSQLFYLAMGVQLVRQYHRANQAMRSDAYTIQLKWLSKLLVVVILLSLIDLTRVNLQPYLPIPFLKAWYFYMQLAYFILFGVLIFKAMRQPETFQSLSEFEAIEATISKPIEEKSQAITLFNQIHKYIQQQQSYLQPRLSLKDLHQALGINEKELSWAINNGSQHNFCDYINQLRVQHFKSLAQQDSRASILQMAMDSGFSSKSSFNAVFKKHSGLTPSEYLKSL